MAAEGSKRLGLAFSGGGFRASFFHLGVLRRLAELDLLQHVTTLSTVSGGSIIAAHYYLAFKEAFERNRGVLTAKDYIEIVQRVEREFIAGNAEDLRNRLLMNPLTHIRAFTTGRGYGRQMARLYTKYLYAKVTHDIFAGCTIKGSERYADEGVPLHHAITRVPDLAGAPANGRRLPNKSSGYPGEAMPSPNLTEFNAMPGKVTIPHFVINATCLNTGGPFHFMLNEVGGPETGYVRYDELFMLLQFKSIIAGMGDESADSAFLATAMENALSVGKFLEKVFDEFPDTAFKRYPAHLGDDINFYLAASKRARIGRAKDETSSWLADGWSEWQPESTVLRTLIRPENWLAVQHLLGSDFGSLRRAKVAAWYWLDENGWRERERRGGFTRDEYRRELLRESERIDGSLVAFFENDVDTVRFAYFILDLYYLRSAKAIGWNAPDALRELTLSDAVAASANFPPVFTPFEITGLFDHERFHVLSLTDGGVHDNQGIEAVIDDRVAYLIASDAGGLVAHEPEPPDARVPMMNRIIDVLMGGVRQAQMRSIDETCRVATILDSTRTAGFELFIEAIDHLSPAYALRRIAVFHMTSNPREAAVDGLAEFEPMATAHIRTDLDAFSEMEVAALMYQGYHLADRYARWFYEDRRSPFFVKENRPQPQAPADLRRMPDDAVDILHGSRLLAGRFTRVHPFAAMVLAVISGIVFAVLGFPKWAHLRWLWNYKTDWWVIDAELAAKREVAKHAVQLAKSSWAAWLSHFVGSTSLLTMLFFGWAAYALAAHLIRKISERRRRGVVSHVSLRRRARLWTIATTINRWPNYVSVVSVVMFLFTLNVKWAVLFIPLWSIPFSIVFVFARCVFTPLWKRTGRLKPQTAVLSVSAFDGVANH